MGIIKDLLYKAAGEITLTSAFGRYNREVADNVDALAEAAATGPNLIQVLAVNKLFTQGQEVSQALIFDTVIFDGGVPYDKATGLFSLQADRLYSLRVQGKWRDIPGLASATHYYWRRSDKTFLVEGINGIPDQPYASPVAVNANANISSTASTELIYRPEIDEQVEVALNVGPIGSTILLESGFAIVERL